MNVKYIIPVGDNCEIGCHLTRNGYSYSSLFRYAGAELENVISVIENDFSNLFSYEKITPVHENMVMCENYWISWHTGFSASQSKLGEDWTFNEKSYSQYEKEISKLNHLKDNLIKALECSSGVVLFIYRSKRGRFSELIRFVDLVEKKYPQLDFKLLVVKSRDQSLKVSHRRIDVENVSFLAPYEEAVLGGDDKNWNKILGKYIDVPAFEKIAFLTCVPKGNQIADYLRDIALKFEELDDVETAYKLMLQASYCRPTGQYIAMKLDQYKKKLGRD